MCFYGHHCRCFGSFLNIFFGMQKLTTPWLQSDEHGRAVDLSPAVVLLQTVIRPLLSALCFQFVKIFSAGLTFSLTTILIIQLQFTAENTLLAAILWAAQKTSNASLWARNIFRGDCGNVTQNFHQVKTVQYFFYEQKFRSVLKNPLQSVIVCSPQTRLRKKYVRSVTKF